MSLGCRRTWGVMQRRTLRTLPVGGGAGAVGEGQNLDVGFVKQEEPGKKRGSGWTDRP